MDFDTVIYFHLLYLHLRVCPRLQCACLTELELTAGSELPDLGAEN